MTGRTAASRFVIELQGRGHDDDIRHLRAILKSLLRRHHFRCVAAREVANGMQHVPPGDKNRKHETHHD
jgi:hypothetical protein